MHFKPRCFSKLPLQSKKIPEATVIKHSYVYARAWTNRLWVYWTVEFGKCFCMQGEKHWNRSCKNRLRYTQRSKHNYNILMPLIHCVSVFLLLGQGSGFRGAVCWLRKRTTERRRQIPTNQPTSEELKSVNSVKSLQGERQAVIIDLFTRKLALLVSCQDHSLWAVFISPWSRQEISTVFT